MSDRTPKKPTHDLSVVLKDGTRGKVGCGWLNEDGSISIQLETCVVLESKDIQHLALFKRGEWKGKA